MFACSIIRFWNIILYLKTSRSVRLRGVERQLGRIRKHTTICCWGIGREPSFILLVWNPFSETEGQQQHWPISTSTWADPFKCVHDPFQVPSLNSIGQKIREIDLKDTCKTDFRSFPTPVTTEIHVMTSQVSSPNSLVMKIREMVFKTHVTLTMYNTNLRKDNSNFRGIYENFIGRSYLEHPECSTRLYKQNRASIRSV